MSEWTLLSAALLRGEVGGFLRATPADPRQQPGSARV